MQKPSSGEGRETACYEKKTFLGTMRSLRGNFVHMQLLLLVLSFHFHEHVSCYSKAACLLVSTCFLRSFYANYDDQY